MNYSSFRLYKLYLLLNLKTSLSKLSIITTPLLLSIVMLIVFNFVFVNFEISILTSIYSLCGCLITFIGLQTFYTQAFHAEISDRAIDILQTSPTLSTALYLAKLTSILTQSLLLLIVCLACVSFFNPYTVQVVFNPTLILANLLALVGLCALGVTLTTILSCSSNFSQIYPLAYFPLSTPILISVATITEQLCNGSTAQLSQWLWLLGGISAIYLCLGYICFGVIFDFES